MKRVPNRKAAYCPPVGVKVDEAFGGMSVSSTGIQIFCACCLYPEPTAAAAQSDRPPELPNIEKLSACVSRVMGQNPSSFALTGTCMYLVGTGAKRILIDAGEAKPGVLQNLISVMDREGCKSLDQIVLTHWHHDHILGVPELLAHFGPVPVRKFLPSEGTEDGSLAKFDPNQFLKDVPILGLVDGEVLRCEGATLRVLYTPGHANDHVALMLEEEQALFTGDNILGWGTGVFSDLQSYMKSLRLMLDSRPVKLYPAHGPVVEQGQVGPWIEMYISHRQQRIEQVLKALHAAPVGGMSLEEVVRIVYEGQPNVFSNPALLAGATNNSKLVIDYLVKEGTCFAQDGRYSSRASCL